MIENFFTEERRIQKIVNEAVNDAVNEAVLEERQKLEEKVNKAVLAERQKLEKTFKINEIIHFSELNIPKEKIIEITGYPIELVNEVLNKSNN